MPSTARTFRGGSEAATLTQISVALENHPGPRKTVGFRVARRKGNSVQFLLHHDHDDPSLPKPAESVVFDPHSTTPMQLALSGTAGTLIGPDHDGIEVLAAYQPIPELKLGLVMQVDLAEVRAPFVTAALIAAGITFCVVLLGVLLFARISNPLVVRLEAYSRDLEKRVMDRTTELLRIKWLLRRGDAIDPQHAPGTPDESPHYGDLTALNTSRTILDSLGGDLLRRISGDYLALLETSAAIYETNGDYAVGLFSSGWCRTLDEASRNLCDTPDNAEALKTGRWLCHESCWTDAAKPCVEQGRPVDVECSGGLRLYAVPIRAGDEIVGSMNFGYGDPPRDPEKLREIAEKFSVRLEDLRAAAAAYESRPPFIIDAARSRLRTSAALVGELIRRKRVGEEASWREARANNEFASLSQALLLSHSLDEISLKLMECGQRLTESSAGFVGHIDPLTRLAVTAAITRGTWDECTIRQAGGLPEMSEGLLGWVLQNGKPLLSNAPSQDSRSQGVPAGHIRIERLLAFPALAGAELVGIVAFANSRREYTAQDLNLAQRLADFFALAIQRKQARDELLVSERLASVGTLAAGVAHQINNPLGAILNSAELALHCQDDPDAAAIWKEALITNVEQSRRCGRIVRSLLKFSRNAVSEKLCEDLSDVAERACDLCRPYASDRGSVIEYEPSQERRPVWMSAIEMEQVLVNLIRNAIESRETGAVVEVCHQCLSSTSRILVKDNGCGIEEAQLKHIFDPFYTNRLAVGGTGLGLSVAHGIVTDHDGTIWVDSKPNIGTTFTIELPHHEVA